MNITAFNREFHCIIDKLNLVLNTKTVLSKTEFFIEGLNLFQEIIKKDDIKLPIESWHIARRIFCYTEIKRMFNKIVTQNPNLLLSSSANDKINTLTNLIESLKDFVKNNTRLPFFVGKSREDYFYDVKQGLKLKDRANVYFLEKEFFHLVSAHLKKIEDVDTYLYQGSHELHGLISWKSLLKQYIQKVNKVDKEALLALSIINKAIPFALKTTFARLRSSAADQTKLEMRYFEDFALCKPQDPRSIAAFLRKYEFKEKNHIPKSTIINEITWDIINSINKLNDNNEELFLLGLRDHCIAVQILCKKRASSSAEGNYEYKIINTGDGVSHHIYYKSENKALPLIFENVPKKAFTYIFIESLLKSTIDSVNIDDFYALHDEHLIQKSKAVKFKDKGTAYDLQQYGTCVYKCIEEFIHSKLKVDNFKRLIDFKIKTASDKFEQSIKLYEKKQKNTSNQLKRSRSKRKADSLLDLPPAKRIKSDRSLLQSAKQCQVLNGKIDNQQQ